MLRDAGIDVRCGLMTQEARETNIGFFSRMTRGRPWVRLKLAGSLDGRSALLNGHSQWITAEAARLDGHRWRARACAVLTGIGTVLADNPQLSARGVGARRQPVKVIADSNLRTPAGARVFDGTEVWLACTAVPARDDAWFRQRQAQALVLPGRDGTVDLQRLLLALGERGINELHVEAGARLAGALLDGDCVDEILLYQAPCLLGPGQPIANLPTLAELGAAQRWHIRDLSLVGPDARFLLRRPPAPLAAPTGESGPMLA